jgi:hypothetical protein
MPVFTSTDITWSFSKLVRDSDLCMAIKDFGRRIDVDSGYFHPARVIKEGGIGVYGSWRVCAKRNVIALIERNRSNDFA